MKIETQTLMKEFYELHKHEYPDRTFEEMRSICYGQFAYVKDEMQSGRLKNIRLKYLALFVVYEGSALGTLRGLKKLFAEHKLEPNYYFTKKAMLEKFLYKKETEVREKDYNDLDDCKYNLEDDITN
jgi:hypothetical protein